MAFSEGAVLSEGVGSAVSLPVGRLRTAEMFCFMAALISVTYTTVGAPY